MTILKMVKPDIKGTITLGHLTNGVNRYAVFKDEFNRIILEPYVEIPAKEHWLFDNPKTLLQVKQAFHIT